MNKATMAAKLSQFTYTDGYEKATTKSPKPQYDGNYRDTERRLYMLPQLIMRVSQREGELLELGEIEVDKLKSSSKSFASLLRPGMRIDPIEAHAAQIAYLKAQISIDKFEIRKLKRALSAVRKDPYYAVLIYRYFENRNDDEIAEIISCSASTIRRNRARLVKTLGTLLA